MKFSVVVFAALEQINSITIDFILIILFISYKLKSNACQKPELLNLNTYICTNPLTMGEHEFQCPMVFYFSFNF